MQELLRHSSVRCTLDTYTQAIMPAKRAAQAAVVFNDLEREAPERKSKLHRFAPIRVPPRKR